MNKRLLTLVMAICVLAPMTLSARAFDFNLGATAQYQNDVSTDGFDFENLVEVENYRFGAETRLNFLLVEVTDTALVGQTSIEGIDDFAVEFSNHLAVGLYTDVADVVRLGLLAGPEFGMNITKDGVKNEDGSDFDFADIFMESNFTYKAHADFLLGETLTLSASYTLPTSFNLNDADIADLIPSASNWDEGRVGISVLLF